MASIGPAPRVSRRAPWVPWSLRPWRRDTNPVKAAARRPITATSSASLTAQGPNAPGGAKDYLVDGHLTGGFALLAYPAEYGNSGVMSFQVNQSGIVYQADLGPETAATAAAMPAYDPGEDWSAVTD